MKNPTRALVRVILREVMRTSLAACFGAVFGVQMLGLNGGITAATSVSGALTGITSITFDNGSILSGAAASPSVWTAGSTLDIQLKTAGLGSRIEMYGEAGGINYMYPNSLGGVTHSAATAVAQIGKIADAAGTGAPEFTQGATIAASKDLTLNDNARIMLGASTDGLMVDEATAALNFVIAGSESSTSYIDIDGQVLRTSIFYGNTGYLCDIDAGCTIGDPSTGSHAPSAIYMKAVASISPPRWGQWV